MPYKTAAKGMFSGLIMMVMAVVVIGAIVLGGWLAGWWFKAENTKREGQVYDQSYGRQQALRDNVGKNIALVYEITAQMDASPDTTDTLRAQRKATVGMVCSDAAKLNDTTLLDKDQIKFVDDNCSAGVVSPTSIYFK